MRSALFAALGIACVVCADVKVNDQPGYWSFNGVDYNTKEQCVAVAKAATIDDETRVCHQLNRVLVLGDCSDVKAPPFTVEQTSELCPNGTDYQLFETRQVEAGYPACWAVVKVVTFACP